MKRVMLRTILLLYDDMIDMEERHVRQPENIRNICEKIDTLEPAIQRINDKL